jgi:membrane associated rhomboid family serine protease
MSIAKEFIKKRKICCITALILILIFIGYFTKYFTNVGYENFTDILLSNFIHIDAFHLFSNLVMLYVFSRVEDHIGFKKFIIVIFSILLLNTVMEFCLRKMKKSSIGFSGILFGLISYEIIANQRLEKSSIFALILNMIPMGGNVDFIGHGIGIISGLLIGTIVK